MKKVIHLLAGVTIIASMTGCATPYLIDRGRDAADVFTVAFGYGAGAKARVGPVHVGLLTEYTMAGLAGGEFLSPPEAFSHGMDTDLILSSYQAFDPQSSHAGDRGKCYDTDPWLRVPFIAVPVDESGPQRHEADIVRAYPYYYYAQIEVVLACYCSVRLGFNPGELLDFILGWARIDIFNDDIELRKLKTESNQASQAIGAPGAPQPER